METSKNTLLAALLLLVVLTLGGCATQGDLDAVQRDSNNLTKEVL